MKLPTPQTTIPLLVGLLPIMVVGLPLVVGYYYLPITPLYLLKDKLICVRLVSKLLLFINLRLQFYRDNCYQIQKKKLLIEISHGVILLVLA